MYAYIAITVKIKCNYQNCVTYRQALQGFVWSQVSLHKTINYLYTSIGDPTGSRDVTTACMFITECTVITQ